jgi:hypothetical protein
MKGCVLLRGFKKCRKEEQFVGSWDTVPQGQRFSKQKLANRQLVPNSACVCVDLNRILLNPELKKQFITMALNPLKSKPREREREHNFL